MSAVVQLSDYRRKSRRDDHPPSSGATIHLFLGVRYERHTDIEPGPARGGRSGKTRKRA